MDCFFIHYYGLVRDQTRDGSLIAGGSLAGQERHFCRHE